MQVSSHRTKCLRLHIQNIIKLNFISNQIRINIAFIQVYKCMMTTSTFKELHVCLIIPQLKVFQCNRERRGRSEYVGETSRYVKCEEAKRCIVPLRSVVGGTFPRSGHLQPRDSSRRAYARACNGTHAFERYFEFRYAFIRYFSFCPRLRPVTSEKKTKLFEFQFGF